MTSRTLAQHWFLALIASLLPDGEGPEWFATHVGYAHDLVGGERRRFQANLVGTFPRQWLTSWGAHLGRVGLFRPVLRGLVAAGATWLVTAGGGLGFMVLSSVPRVRVRLLPHKRCWVMERHGYVTTQRVARLRELPGYERFVAVFADSDDVSSFLEGRVEFVFPSGEVNPPVHRAHRVVTIRAKRGLW
ncbi:hypothetical protein [Saccharothrix yanglingensis]|uniref:hypothetical protein n=1 Tax=Saccharothrix yanglingensis TaxID=659496 RepID=UPI0027D2311B|nr:hypothetical protein [Saccharothrix yanglingensis]